MIEKIGNCRIVEEIGTGGMAVVYRAIQEPLGRVVAVKALKSSIASEPQFAERFEREARFMADLQQENIINVHDFIKFGGTMFMVMEYVEGFDLYDLLEGSNGLPSEVASIIALQVARALNHAHFRGIIHRDIKPANIMVSYRGDVKLMDFGIARTDTLSDLTETGTGLGTPSYMSPEQILGDRLDARTDVWSLGVVFYQMLTGQKPFVDDTKRSVLQKIRLERYHPARRIAPKVPRSIERILSRCLAKLPADRYPSMQALIHDLEDFLASRVVINYNAFMVGYLKDQTLLSEGKAIEILAAGSAQAGQRIIREDRKVLRSVGQLHSVVLALLLLGGLITQLTWPSAISKPAAAAGSNIALDPSRVGYLHVLADPWAEVYVDGTHCETTPFSNPIVLSPGLHYIKMINPYFQSVTREVLIKQGETLSLVEKMAMERLPTSGETR